MYNCTAFICDTTISKPLQIRKHELTPAVIKETKRENYANANVIYTDNKTNI